MKVFACGLKRTNAGCSEEESVEQRLGTYKLTLHADITRHSKCCRDVARSHLKLITAVDLHAKLATLVTDDDLADEEEKCLETY